jgi:hypothetical protein
MYRPSSGPPHTSIFSLSSGTDQLGLLKICFLTAALTVQPTEEETATDHSVEALVFLRHDVDTPFEAQYRVKGLAPANRRHKIERIRNGFRDRITELLLVSWTIDMDHTDSVDGHCERGCHQL